MLPISEFHFAFCGIATVAATLGYACARRAVFSLAPSPNESSKADVEAGSSEERSLKRKLDSDEHDAEQSRPMKRNRTPPADQHESDEDFNQEWEVVVAPPPYDQVVGLRQPEESVQDSPTPPHEDYVTIEQDATPIREPTLPVHSPSPQPEGKAEHCATALSPQVNPSPHEPEIPPTCPVTPPRPAIPVNAFSAFSGSNSPFASYSKSSATSPFALSGQSVRSAPVWRRDNESASDVFGRAGSPNALAPSPNHAVAPATIKPCILSQSKDALGVPSETLVKLSTHLTGEEDETVEAELKGVKLFVKRGRKEFTDGIYGQIKVLTQKSTPPKTGNEGLPAEAATDSRTRLLFRRDPLGQVSMNVGLHSAVRCHFDTAENILRVILMEQKDAREDVVVYALKPGRAQKADFQSFAKALCDHEGLKSSVATSPTITASGTAAAS